MTGLQRWWFLSLLSRSLFPSLSFFPFRYPLNFWMLRVTKKASERERKIERETYITQAHLLIFARPGGNRRPERERLSSRRRIEREPERERERDRRDARDSRSIQRAGRTAATAPDGPWWAALDNWSWRPPMSPQSSACTAMRQESTRVTIHTRRGADGRRSAARGPLSRCLSGFGGDRN